MAIDNSTPKGRALANALMQEMAPLTKEKILKALDEMNLINKPPMMVYDPKGPYGQRASENMQGIGYTPPVPPSAIGGIRTMGASQSSQAAPMSDVQYSSDKLAQMVGMRLRTPPGAYFGNWHFHKTTRDGEEVVYCFIVNDGRATVLEDGWPLFPSDELITKLRLLEK